MKYLFVFLLSFVLHGHIAYAFSIDSEGVVTPVLGRTYIIFNGADTNAFPTGSNAISDFSTIAQLNECEASFTNCDMDLPLLIYPETGLTEFDYPITIVELSASNVFWQGEWPETLEEVSEFPEVTQMGTYPVESDEFIFTVNPNTSLDQFTTETESVCNDVGYPDYAQGWAIYFPDGSRLLDDWCVAPGYGSGFLNDWLSNDAPPGTYTVAYFGPQLNNWNVPEIPPIEEAVSLYTFCWLECSAEEEGGISALIETSNTGFTNTLGFPLANAVTWGGSNVANPIMGTGLATLNYLKYWILALLGISIVIYFAYRAFRFYLS